MKLSLYIFIFCVNLLFSCNHPEKKNFERNQGKNKETYQSVLPNNKTQTINENPNNNTNTNTLKMELENGVKYVWIEINGIRLRFIFDTGASNICISSAEATVLYRQGTLNKDDVIKTDFFQDATGKINEAIKINLREVNIGGKILKNVEAIIIDNVNAPLLLGQSVLERFGKIEINNETAEIYFKD